MIEKYLIRSQNLIICKMFLIQNPTATFDVETLNSIDSITFMMVLDHYDDIGRSREIEISKFHISIILKFLVPKALVLGLFQNGL